MDNPVQPGPGLNLMSQYDEVDEFMERSQSGKRRALHDRPSVVKLIPKGSFALCLLNPGEGRVSYLRGSPAAKWWASPMLFWDDFLRMMDSLSRIR